MTDETVGMTSIIEQITQNLDRAHALLTPQKSLDTPTKSFNNENSSNFSNIKPNTNPNTNLFGSTKKKISSAPRQFDDLHQQIATLTQTIQTLTLSMEAQRKENERLRLTLHTQMEEKNNKQETKTKDSSRRRTSIFNGDLAEVLSLERKNVGVLMFLGATMFAIAVKLFLTYEEPPLI
jgi:hypothetical protein